MYCGKQRQQKQKKETRHIRSYQELCQNLVTTLCILRMHSMLQRIVYIAYDGAHGDSDVTAGCRCLGGLAKHPDTMKHPNSMAAP